MKIQVEKSEFVDCLKKATSLIGIAKNDIVSISTDENKNVILKVPTMTKISKGGMFSAKIDANIEDKGGVIVCAKKLFQFAKLLKGDTISIIDVDDEGYKYTFVTDGHSKFNLPLQKGNFALPEIIYTDTIEVTASNFKNLINKTAFVCKKQDYGVNGICCCIHFSATNDGFLKASATNLNQLACNNCRCVQSENPVNFTAYASEIQKFAAILPDCDDNLKIEFGTSDKLKSPFAKFSFGNFELVTMLNSAKFPDIMQILSSKKPTAILDTKEFKNTLDAMSLITKHCDCNVVYLKFSNNVLKFTADSKDFGKCESTIDCSNLTENAFVSVDSVYLANAVNQIANAEFSIIITDCTVQITNGNFSYITCQTDHVRKKLSECEPKQIDPPTVDVAA